MPVCCVLFSPFGRRKPWSWWDVQRLPFKKPHIQRTERQIMEKMNGRDAGSRMYRMYRTHLLQSPALRVKCWLALLVWLGTKQDFFRSCPAGRGGAGTEYAECDLTQPLQTTRWIPPKYGGQCAVKVKQTQKHREKPKSQSTQAWHG